MDTVTDFISKKNQSINIQKYVVAGASKVCNSYFDLPLFKFNMKIVCV